MKLLITLLFILSTTIYGAEGKLNKSKIDDLCKSVKNNKIENVSSILGDKTKKSASILVKSYNDIKCTGQDKIPKDLLIFAIDENSTQAYEYLVTMIATLETEVAYNIINKSHNHLEILAKRLKKYFKILSNLSKRVDKE